MYVVVQIFLWFKNFHTSLVSIFLCLRCDVVQIFLWFKIFQTSFIFIFLCLLGDTHGNVLASVQDSRGNLRRLQTLQNNMERVLAEKLKELDTMNAQVKVSKQNLLL